jgi:predicted AlkP superfamily pyrophosphatase or phosphodiesterase
MDLGWARWRPHLLVQNPTILSSAWGVSELKISFSNSFQSTFLTKTFPNHWSLVTGLYEESHGIIDNYINIGDRNFNFKDDSTQKSSDYGGEAIWQTVSKNGGKSCVHFWPGSEAEGQQPDLWSHFEMFQGGS